MRERIKSWLILLAIGTGLLLAMGAEGGMTAGTLTETTGVGLILSGVVLVSLPVAIAVARERAANKKAAPPNENRRDGTEKEDAA